MKIILAIILFTLSTISQITGENGLQEMLMEDKLDELKGMEELTKTSVPYSTRVNPDVYRSGPGDVFLFKILPLQPKPEYIVVDPEGQLVLPRSYGIIDVYDKTLTEIKEELREKLAENITNSTMVLSLYKPRTVIVRVEGNVDNEGVFTLPASMTVKDAINYANNLNDRTAMTQDNQIKDFNKYANKELKKDINTVDGFPRNNIFEMRNIILQNNGKARILDLVSGEINNSDENPFLREGDVIKVPKMEENKNFYSVVGEVHSPSNISHRDGDKASLAIKIAGGVTENADLDKSFIFLPDATKVKLKFNENGELIDFDPEVKNGTTILIGSKKDKNKSENGLVSLKGEFFNEGSYVIQNGKTTLKELIEMAGGIKNTACLNLGNIINLKKMKDKNFVLQQEEMKRLMYFDLSVEDTIMINNENRFAEPRVSIDFNEVLNSDDIEIHLQDGDLIEIPKCPTRIMVRGRVTQPGFVEFKPGKHPMWYVNMAGGEVESADIDRLSLIRGGSNMWVDIDDDTVVMPGDVIYVPTYPMVSRITKTQEYAALAGILGAIGALGIFLIQVINLVDNQ